MNITLSQLRKIIHETLSQRDPLDHSKNAPMMQQAKGPQGDLHDGDELLEMDWPEEPEVDPDEVPAGFGECQLCDDAVPEKELLLNRGICDDCASMPQPGSDARVPSLQWVVGEVRRRINKKR